MFGLPGILGTISDLLAVIVGFGLIVFLHELGHFVAARWAGIRVLVFAVGFGPPVWSWRKGVGLRRGSSADEYEKLIKEGRGAASSPTEYRLSALPFGGYVQMLGQDDLDPGAVSAAPDSYQNTAIWKRMIVISAGVVMNLITAGVLFVVVFMAGLKVAPPVVGMVQPDSPGAIAKAANGDEVGLKPGDTILEIGGDKPRRFESVVLAVAMAEAGRPLDVEVRRDGVEKPLRFAITPRMDEQQGLLSIGVGAPVSTTLADPPDEKTRRLLRDELARVGVSGLEPGDRVEKVDGAPVDNGLEIEAAFKASGGRPLSLAVERGGDHMVVEARPQPDMELAEVNGEQASSLPVDHLLGLVPVIRVADSGDEPQGLEHGDVFLRIGSIEFPSWAAAINEIRAHRRESIDLVVWRDGKVIKINAKVTKDGRVGFVPDDTLRTDTLLAMPPRELRAFGSPEPVLSPAAGLFARAGARITAVAGRPVSNFADIRAALIEATAKARAAGAADAAIDIAYCYPFAETDADKTLHATWNLDSAALERLGALGWHSPIPSAYFEIQQIVLKAEGPLDAVRLGVLETHRVMLNVYVTFLRLTQGSLEVKNIKGPVGIAHIGTMVAERGVIWMLFFLGLISVNLAVVNFLPLPIVDGGQFLMLLYEQIRGKPVPIPVQNAVMTAGLLLIVSVFLVVTFNDIMGLLGG
ncbi:MAG: site-2 protease family protein [Phycisphaeraceae bacterium]|nr:MAG: site-2 protease family protein [Phycisphaeraceae bacterium]